MNLPPCENVFVTPRSIFTELFHPSQTRAEQWKTWGQIRWHSAFLFQLSYYRSVLFPVYFVSEFGHLGAFCWWLHCLDWSPKCQSAVWGPTCKKAVMCLAEAINMVDKLHLGMSFCDTGCGINVNESPVHIK